MSTPTSVEQLQARVSYLEERNAELEAEDATRRQAWEQQSPAKAQLELLLARSPVIVWAVDAAGRITRLRGHGLTWLGLHDGDLVGRAAAELFGDAPAVVESLERALRGEEFSTRVRVRDVFLDCRYVPVRNVDGDVTGVQGTGVIATAGELARMCFATSEALLAQAAQPGPIEAGTLAALRQRQERLGVWLQRAEGGTEPLGLPEPTLADLAGSLPDYVVAVDARGTVLEINRAPRGVSPADVVGSTVFEFLPPSEHAAARAALSGAVEQGDSTRREFTITRLPGASTAASTGAAADMRTGEPARLLCHVAPARREGQDGAIVVATDITIRRLREAVARRRRLRYEQTVRLMLLGEMAGILAHKVNNPLAAITNFARGCVRRLRQVDGDGGMGLLIEALEEITEQANRASLSLRQVRNFLQPRDTVYRQVSPMAVVRRAVDMVEPLARARRVTLTVTGSRSLPPICVDPLQIEQVLVHLLLNGIEAVAPERPTNGTVAADLRARSAELTAADTTAPHRSAGVPSTGHEAGLPPTAAVRTLAGRVVSVSVVARQRGTVEFTVSDSGPGVPASLHEMIFEPFFTTKPRGIGMGLAVSRSIVASHSGRLWIDRPETPTVPDADAGRDTPSPGAHGAQGVTAFRFTLPGRESGASHE